MRPSAWRRPLMLLVARLIQGLSLGGEYGTSATYLSEMAKPERRGFYSSFQYVTLIGGQLSAMLVLIVLQKFVLTRGRTRSLGLAHSVRHRRGARRRRLPHAPRHARDRGLHDVETRRNTSFKTLMEHPREVAIVVGLTHGRHGGVLYVSPPTCRSSWSIRRASPRRPRR